MNISFHDVWESIQGYIVYIVGITIALCIDTISAIVSYLIYIPTMVPAYRAYDARLQQLGHYIERGSGETLGFNELSTDTSSTVVG